MPKNPIDIWKKSTPIRFLVVGGWNFVFGYAVFAEPYWLPNRLVADWIIAIGAFIPGTNADALVTALTDKKKWCFKDNSELQTPQMPSVKPDGTCGRRGVRR